MMIGIIVEQNFPGSYKIWTSKFKNVNLSSNSLKPVKIGDFVIILSNDNSGYCTEYQVVPPIYKVLGNSKTLQVVMDYHLDFNQSIVNHHFFGVINISNNISTKEGKWQLTIEYGSSTWILKELSEFLTISSPDTPKSVFGIMVSDKHAWCRERPPGQDVTVFTRQYPIATWILMTFPSESEFRSNMTVPVHHQEVAPIHKVYESNRTIGMSLESYVRGSEGIGRDIEHPAVGLILNNKNILFPFTGKYQIEIRRAFKKVAKDGVRWSVWYLIKAISTDTGTAALPVPSAIPRALSPLPTTSHFVPVNQSLVPIHSKTALITKIRGMENSQGSKYEEVYFWTLDDHKEGRLFLENTTEKLNIKMGDLFTGKASNFIMISDEKYKYSAADYTLEGAYNTISSRVRNDFLEVHIVSDKWFAASPPDSCTTVHHAHFGVIKDNRGLLSRVSNWNMTVHCWIKKCRNCWVVCEVIEHF